MSGVGQAWDVADRAWRAGRNYGDIALLFAQARERLAPDGTVYLIISTNSDLAVIGTLIREAGFSAELMNWQFIVLETFLIYRLRVGAAEQDGADAGGMAAAYLPVAEPP